MGKCLITKLPVAFSGGNDNYLTELVTSVCYNTTLADTVMKITPNASEAIRTLMKLAIPSGATKLVLVGIESECVVAFTDEDYTGSAIDIKRLITAGSGITKVINLQSADKFVFWWAQVGNNASSLSFDYVGKVGYRFLFD